MNEHPDISVSGVFSSLCLQAEDLDKTKCLVAIILAFMKHFQTFYQTHNRENN